MLENDKQQNSLLKLLAMLKKVLLLKPITLKAFFHCHSFFNIQSFLICVPFTIHSLIFFFFNMNMLLCSKLDHIHHPRLADSMS